MYFQPTIHRSQNLFDFLPLLMPFCAEGAERHGTGKMYKRCNVEPLLGRDDRNRRRMLGHVVRGPTEGPVYCSFVFALNILQYPGLVEDSKLTCFVDLE